MLADNGGGMWKSVGVCVGLEALLEGEIGVCESWGEGLLLYEDDEFVQA